MQNRISIICFVIGAYLMSSCATGNSTLIGNRDVYVVNLDTINERAVLPLSNIYNSVKAIVLENDKALLGNIDKLQPYQDKLFILDSQIAKGLYEFDREGHFIRKIGQIGSAPGEYSGCGDFAINEQTNEIYVYDYRNHIYKYDLETGKYKDILNLEKENIIDRIWVNGGNLYAVNCGFYPNQSRPYYILKEIDTTNGKKIGEWMKNDEYNKGWIDSYMSFKCFYSIGNDMDLFTYGMSDSIMCIRDGKIAPYVALTGKKLIQKDDIPSEDLTPSTDGYLRTRQSGNLFESWRKQGKISGISNLFRYKQMLFFEIMGMYAYTVQYNISDDKVSIYGSTKENLLFTKEPKHWYLPSFLTADESGTYYCVKPMFLPEFKHFATEKGVMSDKVINKEKLEKLDEDSNPVILYYEFKK